jgi:hypothetical protein
MTVPVTLYNREDSFCFVCQRFHINDIRLPRRCDAFSSGIPDEILNWAVPHTTPYPGDSGMQFKGLEDLTPDDDPGPEDADRGVDPATRL